MNHPSFGKLSPEKFREAQNAPFGGAAEIIRTVDPSWGLIPKDQPIKKYKITLKQQMVGDAYGEVVVDAGDPDNAKEIFKAVKPAVNWNDPENWDLDGSVEFYDIEEV